MQSDPAYISSQYELGNTRTLMGDFAGARQEYDRAMPLAQNPMDELYVKYLKSLVCFWEGEPAEGRKELAALVKEAEGKKEPNSQFQIGFARAMLAVDPQSELEQLTWLSAFLAKPLAGMNESDRGIAELRTLATDSRDQLVRSYFESASGYILFAQGDFANAADELAADSHSALALQQLAVAEERLGNARAAEAARTGLKYHRSSEPEWFLATHNPAATPY